MNDDAARLRRVLDQAEIRDLVLGYCRAVDRRDFALLRTLYHPDATDDHGSYFQGPASEFIDRLPQIMAPNRITAHNVTNMLIAVDGDVAEGEIYTLAYHLMETPDGDVDFMAGGRYLDRYVRHQERWLFMHRQIVLDWNEIQPTRCRRDPAGGTPLGEAGAGDPSYAMFRLLRRLEPQS